LDVGNVMLTGHPEHWIDILGKRIFAVHLKDFRVSVGNMGGFADLLSGDVDFPAVIAALRRSGYEGPFTAEIVPSQPGCVEKAFAAMRIIERMVPGG
jgi:hexulose-6-phosphate isomerase